MTTEEGLLTYMDTLSEAQLPRFWEAIRNGVEVRLSKLLKHSSRDMGGSNTAYPEDSFTVDETQRDRKDARIGDILSPPSLGRARPARKDSRCFLCKAQYARQGRPLTDCPVLEEVYCFTFLHAATGKCCPGICCKRHVKSLRELANYEGTIQNAR